MKHSVFPEKTSEAQLGQSQSPSRRGGSPARPPPPPPPPPPLPPPPKSAGLGARQRKHCHTTEASFHSAAHAHATARTHDGAGPARHALATRARGAPRWHLGFACKHIGHAAWARPVAIALLRAPESAAAATHVASSSGVVSAPSVTVAAETARAARPLPGSFHAARSCSATRWSDPSFSHLIFPIFSPFLLLPFSAGMEDSCTPAEDL